MRAGLLKEIINIKRPTITKNEYGEDTEVYQTIGRYRARIVHNGGSRNRENDEIVFPYQKIFVVRIYCDVTENDIILHRGKEYRVLSIDKSSELQNITIQTNLMEK